MLEAQDAAQAEEAVLPPAPAGAALRRWRPWLGTRTRRKAVAVLDHGERRVFRFLRVFLPETSIARSRRFQYLLASTFLSDGARDAQKYGALVAVTRRSGSSMDAALVGSAVLAPAALLGLYGGALADALPKRTALAVIYGLQAALCVAVPLLLGTDLGAVLFLVFALSLLAQVSTPTEQSIAPLVASDEQMASATSLLSLSSNFGVFFGTALLAPVLLKLLGVTAVFTVSGVMLTLATIRILRVQTKGDPDAPAYRKPSVNLRGLVAWLNDEPAVATMLLLGIIAGMATIVIETMAPRYVQAVLGEDPAQAVYVFAPSSVGIILALLIAPWLIERVGERASALAGFVFTATSLCLLGLVQHGVVAIVDPLNPYRMLNGLGPQLGGPLRTASFLALPLGFGISLAAASARTYINRRVPITHQGRTFALQGVLKNAASIFPLLAIGVVASLVGVDTVLIATPFALLLLAFTLVRLSERYSGRAPAPHLDILSSFLRETAEPVSTPPE